MRVVILLAFVLLLLVGCHSEPAADGGHIVGNGGDGLESTFEQGCIQAKRIAQRLEDPSRAAIPLTWETPVDHAEIASVGHLMLAHFEHLELIWSAKPRAGCPVDKCGCTFPNEPGKIYLSYENCRGHSTRQAGEVCFHEVSHFVPGVDEASAKRLTTLGYSLWRRWEHPDSPHWSGTAYPESKLAYLLPMQVSPETFVFADEESLHRYEIGFNRWTAEKLGRPETPLVVNHMEYPYFRSRPVVISGGLVNYEYCHRQFPEGAGNQFRLSTKQWSPIPKRNAPSSRFKSIALAIDRGLFVWGGEKCTFHDDSGIGGLIRDGGIYSFDGGWELIAEGGPDWVTRNTQAVWTGNEVILWGGSAVSQGAAYNPKTKQWRTLGDPTHEQPSPRMHHAMIWDGKRVIVYGGCWPADFNLMRCFGQPDIKKDGGSYDPVSDRWKSFSTPEGPEASADFAFFPSLVAKQLALFTNERFYFLDTRTSKWTTSERSVYGGHYFYWTGYEIVHFDRSHVQIYYPY